MGGMKLVVGRKMIGTHQGPPRIIPRSSEPPQGLSCPATAVPGEPKPDRFADGCGIFKGIAKWQPTHPQDIARLRESGWAISSGHQFGESASGRHYGRENQPAGRVFRPSDRSNQAISESYPITAPARREIATTDQPSYTFVGCRFGPFGHLFKPTRRGRVSPLSGQGAEKAVKFRRQSCYS